MPHAEIHRSKRAGWLRAAVLGANDGVISTASLLLGVASSHASHGAVVVAGVAALAAGAMAMGAGEYVSVSSQSDIERADLAIERKGIADDPKAERDELAEIYVGRGVEPDLAAKVADQLMARDALGAHARDELGISDDLRARPLQAAFASLASFTAGAVVPVMVAAFAPEPDLRVILPGASLILLALLGAVAARAGGANMAVGSARVCFWGALAMAVTAGVGALFHAPL